MVKIGEVMLVINHLLDPFKKVVDELFFRKNDIYKVFMVMEKNVMFGEVY